MTRNQTRRLLVWVIHWWSCHVQERAYPGTDACRGLGSESTLIRVPTSSFRSDVRSVKIAISRK